MWTFRYEPPDTTLLLATWLLLAEFSLLSLSALRTEVASTRLLGYQHPRALVASPRLLNTTGAAICLLNVRLKSGSCHRRK